MQLGRWMVMAALEEAVPIDSISAALFVRFRSRREHAFAERLLSAMRSKFGGHAENPVTASLSAGEDSVAQKGIEDEV